METSVSVRLIYKRGVRIQTPHPSTIYGITFDDFRVILKSIVQLEHCLMDSRLSTSYWNWNKKILATWKNTMYVLAHF